MIRLYNDPNMFGILPDPPEPIDCDGCFDEDKCRFCMDYDECKQEREDEE